MKISDCCKAEIKVCHECGDPVCTECEDHCEEVDADEPEPDDRFIETPEQFRDRMVEYKKLK